MSERLPIILQIKAVQLAAETETLLDADAHTT